MLALHELLMKMVECRFVILWACFCGFGVAPCVAGQDSKLAAAIPGIQESIRKSGADVGVAFRTLDGKTEWFFRADEAFHAASTMKIPVLIELFNQVHEGKLK